MARPRNHVIYDKNQDTLLRLKEEYELLGRHTALEDGKLVVFALPRRR